MTTGSSSSAAVLAATLIGLGGRASVSQAALINGTAGHALDYDDVLRIMRGHPTAPVAPPVLAFSEREKKSGRDAVTAFVAGIETRARVGAFMGESHYMKGWHQTATVGSFGAAAASATVTTEGTELCTLEMVDRLLPACRVTPL